MPVSCASNLGTKQHLRLIYTFHIEIWVLTPCARFGHEPMAVAVDQSRGLNRSVACHLRSSK
jgi:hypothetical protein